MVYYHSSYGSPKRKKRTFRKFLWILLFILIVVGSSLGYFVYGVIYKPNVWTAEGKVISIKIPTGTDFEGLKKILYENGLIIHRNNFEWVANYKSFGSTIKPGNYEITNGLSNNDLINLLRSGNQTPIKVIFNNVKDIYQLSAKIGLQLEIDSAEIANFINSGEFDLLIENDSIDKSVYFIPNTYEFYWNTSAKGFCTRMVDEYNKFWNTSRRNKASKLNLGLTEVITLASIVEKETHKNDEKPIIAGVYLNRLERKWLLQADPTLLYILDDNSIRRVLNVHKLIDSPYNTYKYLGLPPGPICIPSISSIDAVLNRMETDYLFFCAKDDLSGYHAFATNIKEHNANARKYQQALNKLKIYK